MVSAQCASHAALVRLAGSIEEPICQKRPMNWAIKVSYSLWFAVRNAFYDTLELAKSILCLDHSSLVMSHFGQQFIDLELEHAQVVGTIRCRCRTMSSLLACR